MGPILQRQAVQHRRYCQVAVGWGAGGEGGIVSGYLASVRGGDAFSCLQPGEFLERRAHTKTLAGSSRQAIAVSSFE
jgi:hypothetical protein